MKVIAAAFPPVARVVNQGAHNGDAESTDRTLFCRSVQIGLGMGEWVKGQSVVEEIVALRRTGGRLRASAAAVPCLS
jgi:hypothetical protein